MEAKQKFYGIRARSVERCGTLGLLLSKLEARRLWRHAISIIWLRLVVLTVGRNVWKVSTTFRPFRLNLSFGKKVFHLDNRMHEIVTIITIHIRKFTIQRGIKATHQHHKISWIWLMAIIKFIERQYNLESFQSFSLRENPFLAISKIIFNRSIQNL